MKIDEVQNLSAYAVYNNKIQGVKVYQEANKPKSSPKPRKKSRTSSTEVHEPLQKSSNNGGLNTTTSSESSGKKNKRKRKNKQKASVEENVVPEASEGPKSKKSKRESLKTSIELSKGGLLPNPFAQKKGQGSNNGTPLTASTSSPPKKGVLKKSVGNVKINGTSPLASETKTLKKAEQQNEIASNKADLNSSGAAKKKKKKQQGNSSKLDNDPSVLSSSPTTKSPQQNKINNKDTPNKKAKKQSPSIETAAATTHYRLPVVPANIKNNSKAIVVAAAADEANEPSEIPLEVLLGSRHVKDSVEHGKNLFQWLISPVSTTKFMTDYWEKAPLHVKRIDIDPDYYKWILSSSKLDDVMRNNLIRYGKNIDITSYTDGQRQTHNPVGRAMPAAVWDYYTNGCSVRFLNPQTYVKPLWRLNTSLQEYFGTFVGANVYLTPADSQGFAPHYDDIEAFILQVEGRKHWKLYKPRTSEEELPRVSSGNFSEETDNLGEPILDVVLEEGDLLYFPRGMIHQAKAVDEHSLHITISCYQTNTWGDLLKEYLSTAVDQAMENSVEFRRGLPIDYLAFMGIAHQDNPDKEIVRRRKTFMNHSKKLIQQLVNSTTPDLAADQLGKKFMWDALPPYLTVKEKKISSFGDGEFMEGGEVYNRCEFDPDIEVKLVRKNCIRLVCEENTFRIYFTSENSMEYHGEEAQFLEITPEAVDAIKQLIATYPEYVKIEELPLKNLDHRIQLVSDLWERGLVVTEKPLVPVCDDNEINRILTMDDVEVDFSEGDEDEDDYPEEEDDSVDIGDDSEDSELAEFDDDSDDDDDDDSEDEFPLGPFGDHEADDDDDDDDDSDILGLDSFDDFVERVVSDEDENGMGKSYVEEIHSSEDEVPQLVASSQRKPRTT